MVDLPESDWCCGCAGSFVLKHPELSDRILARKVAALRDAGADVVLTTNPGCLLQIRRGIEAAGIEMKVEHLTTFLLNNLRDAGSSAKGKTDLSTTRPTT
jgi:glycolate oxidase iron-sulfur subunit